MNLRYESKVFFVLLAVFVMVGASAWLFVIHWYVYAALLIPVLAVLFYYLYKQHTKVSEEIQQFAEALKYKDFTSRYNEKDGTKEIQVLRKSFNEINGIIKSISKEKEVQYQYLQSIFELVDTGIMSYDLETGEVGWMNHSLKQLLEVPYLKNMSSLEKRNESLAAKISAIQPGVQEVYSLQTNNTTYKILLSATILQTEMRTYKLVAFQNTGQVLDETENDAWQKLLRVMTHEIMNSVAPIASLADTLSNLLDTAIEQGDKESVADIRTGIKTIKTRSEGLLKFTRTYRDLFKINTIEKKEISVSNLFETIYNLMLPNMEQKQIAFEVILKEPELTIQADGPLIEQALINLVLNAIEAVKDRQEPCITLSAYSTENNKAIIKVNDNGAGIDPDVIDKIFIPFFTTKKNGNGIGLNLCRRVMMLHKGAINVQSVKDVGTEFSLHF